MIRISPVLVAILILCSCSDMITTEHGTELGDSAPPLTATAEDGHQVALSDYRGSYVIVEFYASWCGPCYRELPKLKQLYADYKNEDTPLEVISVALEKDRTTGLKFLEQADFPWSHQIVNESKFVRFDSIASAYEVTEIPSTFLIGPSGKILAAHSNVDDIKLLLNSL